MGGPWKWPWWLTVYGSAVVSLSATIKIGPFGTGAWAQPSPQIIKSENKNKEAAKIWEGVVGV